MNKIHDSPLVWHHEQPYSSAFEDVYFNFDASNPNAGIEETDYVFIQHNNLIERWRGGQSDTFTIAETGFGTGLNFMRTWQHWLATQHAQANGFSRLHYVATEMFPLSVQEIASTLALWPQFGALTPLFLSKYAAFTPGIHRLYFAQGNVSLTLLIGDSAAMLAKLYARIDAWYLDGFAPAKNPDMWSETLFAQMRRLSAPESSFATYTAASMVRKSLLSAGFHVYKAAGYGKKREMLYGNLGEETLAPLSHVTENQAVHLPPKKMAIIIGAGIAGCSTARALAERGWDVTILEQSHRLAQGASGNPVGILYPSPGKQDSAPERLTLVGLSHTNQLIASMHLSQEAYQRCGLLQIARTPQEVGHIKAVASRNLPTGFVKQVTAQEASALAGIPIQNESLWFPEAGWLNPVALCESLTQHPKISIVFKAEVVAMHHAQDWTVTTQQQINYVSPIVIVCNAQAAQTLLPCAHLPLQAVRGQVCSIPSTPNSVNLQTVICSHHYITPALNEKHIIGASFVPDSTSTALSSEEQSMLLEAIRDVSPDLDKIEGFTPPQGRAAVRCATPDHLPCAGPLIQHQALMSGTYRYNTPAEHLPWWPGLYCNLGHGSKGLLTAPICGEYIASLIANDPLPLDSDILKAINPNRFSFKQKGLNALSATTVDWQNHVN